jgi:D-amino peptidase
LYPLPSSFSIEVTYRQHALALRNSFYPGATRSGARCVRFETEDYREALRFMLFCL